MANRVRAPTILILSLSDPARDPRVDRQIAALADRVELTVAALGKSDRMPVESVALSVLPRTATNKLLVALRLLFRRFERHVATTVERYGMTALRSRRFDLILCNDVQSLPIAFLLSDGAPVLVDLHEYAPREFEDRLVWRLLYARYNDWLCRRFLPRTAGSSTVCKAIAEEYSSSYGVEPIVVTNAPSSARLDWRPTDGSRIRIIHHGAAAPSRRIENMIETIRLLDDRFTADFILIPGDEQYISTIKARAKNCERIRFLPPVPMKELVKFSSAYDIGLFLLEPTNFNYLYALPNKFFEYLHAHLAIAIGPSPAMAEIVLEFGCGIVAPTFAPAELASMLNSLDAQKIDQFRRRASEAAAAHSAERNAERIRQQVFSQLLIREA